MSYYNELFDELQDFLYSTLESTFIDLYLVSPEEACKALTSLQISADRSEVRLINICREHDGYLPKPYRNPADFIHDEVLPGHVFKTKVGTAYGVCLSECQHHLFMISMYSEEKEKEETLKIKADFKNEYKKVMKVLVKLHQKINEDEK